MYNNCCFNKDCVITYELLIIFKIPILLFKLVVTDSESMLIININKYYDNILK